MGNTTLCCAPLPLLVKSCSSVLSARVPSRCSSGFLKHTFFRCSCSAAPFHFARTARLIPRFIHPCVPCSIPTFPGTRQTVLHLLFRFDAVSFRHAHDDLLIVFVFFKLLNRSVFVTLLQVSLCRFVSLAAGSLSPCRTSETPGRVAHRLFCVLLLLLARSMFLVNFALLALVLNIVRILLATCKMFLSLIPHAVTSSFLLNTPPSKVTCKSRLLWHALFGIFLTMSLT